MDESNVICAAPCSAGGDCNALCAVFSLVNQMKKKSFHTVTGVAAAGHSGELCE
jgi:ATP-dependent protease ClpP protease subunit